MRRPSKPTYECIGDLEEMADLEEFYNGIYYRDQYIRKLERYANFLEKELKQCERKARA